MDILNHNFEAKLPLVLDAINDCDFLTIDAEFSGIDHRFAAAAVTLLNSGNLTMHLVRFT
jgi:hypothetical protein